MTRTVLVVDDEPDIRLLVELALSHVAGWRVLLASGGAAALEVAAAEGPQAVVLDVMMPGMDGPETARRLAADPRSAHIPVVMLTADVGSARPGEPSAPAAAPGTTGGVRGALRKPFDPLTLAHQIEEVLGWTP